MKSLRCRTIALLMIGSIINSLTRPLLDGSGLPAGPFEIAIR
jgi:hypothetical protein